MEPCAFIPMETLNCIATGLGILIVVSAGGVIFSKNYQTKGLAAISFLVWLGLGILFRSAIAAGNVSPETCSSILNLR